MKRLALALCLVFALSTTGARAGGDRISIDARETDIADVIRLIGFQSGYNVVADGSIKPQRITFRLRDVDFDTAMSTLAQAYSLQTHHEGRVIIVGDAAAMNRRYADESGTASAQTAIIPLLHARPEEVTAILASALPAGTVAVADKRTSAVLLTGSPPTITRARRLIAALDAPAYGTGGATTSASIPLRNAKPSDAVKALKGAVPDNSLVADDRQNVVIVSGSAETVLTARSLLNALDLPGRQVMFEVRVADVKPLDENSNVGIEFGGASYGTGALGQFPYTLTKSSIVVNAQVNALVSNGRAEILATPRIATVNNKEASLLVGEEYPVVTVNQQTGFPTVQTIDVGVRLRLTPTIGDDGTITADLHPEYSQIIGFNSNFPIVANRKVDSTLRVKSGETIVLGGLFSDISSDTVSKLPFLGDIPGLGGFFRNKLHSRTRDEVVFFITPRLL